MKKITSLLLLGISLVMSNYSYVKAEYINIDEQIEEEEKKLEIETVIPGLENSFIENVISDSDGEYLYIIGEFLGYYQDSDEHFIYVKKISLEDYHTVAFKKIDFQSEWLFNKTVYNTSYYNSKKQVIKLLLQKDEEDTEYPDYTDDTGKGTIYTLNSDLEIIKEKPYDYSFMKNPFFTTTKERNKTKIIAYDKKITVVGKKIYNSPFDEYKWDMRGPRVTGFKNKIYGVYETTYNPVVVEAKSSEMIKLLYSGDSMRDFIITDENFLILYESVLVKQSRKNNRQVTIKLNSMGIISTDTESKLLTPVQMFIYKGELYVVNQESNYFYTNPSYEKYLNFRINKKFNDLSYQEYLDSSNNFSNSGDAIYLTIRKFKNMGEGKISNELRFLSAGWTVNEIKIINNKIMLINDDTLFILK